MRPLAIWGIVLLLSGAAAAQCTSYLPDPATFPFPLTYTTSVHFTFTVPGQPVYVNDYSVPSTVLFPNPRDQAATVLDPTAASLLFQDCGNGFPSQTGTVSFHDTSTPQQWVVTITIFSGGGLMNITEDTVNTVTNADGACPLPCSVDDIHTVLSYQYDVVTGAYTISIQASRHFLGGFANSGITEQFNGGQRSTSGTWPVLKNQSCRVKPTHTYYQFAAQPQIDYKIPRFLPYLNTPHVPQYFGSLPPPPYRPYVLCPTKKSGCLLSSTATMLTSFAETGLTDLDPYQLDFLLQFGAYDDGLSSFPNPSPPPDLIAYPDRCEVNPAAPQLVAPGTVKWIEGQETNSTRDPAKPSFWDFETSAVVGFGEYLDRHVCGHGDRVILKLAEVIETPGKPNRVGSHFVFVEGKNGSDWDVFDPGWSNAPSTLSGHFAPFSPTGADQRQFWVAGIRTYRDISATGNTGFMGTTANSPVELLVVDPVGRRLGNLNGSDIFEIPQGSYVKDFPLADDVDDGEASGDPTGIKTAGIPSPISGTYQVTATGTALGTYTIRFRSLDATGNLQIASVNGVTNSGSTTVYRVTVSSASGLTGPVAPQASFQSTLADIANSLALGLIDNAGIANALTQKINEAASAVKEHESDDAREALNSFKHQVSTQSGKHITGVAPQVLLEDTDSLVSQIPKGSE